MVYKIKKASYGLRQAPKVWYNNIDSYFCQEGFEKCPHEHTSFIKHGVGCKILTVSVCI